MELSSDITGIDIKNSFKDISQKDVDDFNILRNNYVDLIQKRLKLDEEIDDCGKRIQSIINKYLSDDSSNQLSTYIKDVESDITDTVHIIDPGKDDTIEAIDDDEQSKKGRKKKQSSDDEEKPKTTKRGRPKKNITEDIKQNDSESNDVEEEKPKRGRKKKETEDEEEKPKKRGRPKKNTTEEKPKAIKKKKEESSDDDNSDKEEKTDSSSDE